MLEANIPSKQMERSQHSHTSVEQNRLQALKGYETKRFGESLPRVGALKVGALGVWPKPFTPQGVAESCGFPADCMVLCQIWDLRCGCVSVFPTCFDVLFSLWPSVQESLAGF